MGSRTSGILNGPTFYLRRRHLTAFAVTGVTILIGQRVSRAITATWNGTTDSNWSTGTDWSGGIAPGSTSSTTNTDTAIFNNAGNGNTSITVDANRNIDNITFDTANAAAYSFSGGSLLGTNGGEIQMTSTVDQPQTFSSSLSIESTRGVFGLINNAASPSATLTFAGTIQAAVGGTLLLGGTNTGQNVVSGSIVNGSSATNVVEDGSGTWVLTGNDTYTGATYVLAGTLELPTTSTGSGGSGIDAYGGAVQITGTDGKWTVSASYGGTVRVSGSGQTSGHGFLAEDGGSVTLDNTGTLLNNRDTTGFTVAGGTFNYLSGNGTNTEQEGGVYLGDGASVINLAANSGGSTILTETNINRDSNTFQAGGTLLFVAPNPGATPGAGTANLVISASGNDTAQIGNGGAAGSTDLSIDNYAVIQNTALSSNAQYGLVTGIGSANGLRALTSSEYTTSISDASDTATTLNNANLTTISNVNGATTEINALRLDTGGGVSGSGTLTVNSGAILALSGNAGISVGALNFGSQEAIFHTMGNLTINSNISGSGGLTKTGLGTLYLGSSASVGYTGTTAINQGTIRLGATNQLPTSYPVDMDGGSIDLNGFSQTLVLSSGQLSGSGSSIMNSSSSPATLTVHAGTITPTQYRGTIGAAGENNISLNLDTGSLALSLSHASNYTGSTTISSGDLALDFSEPDSPASNILPATTHLTNGGEYVVYEGDAPTSQTFNGVTLIPGPDVFGMIGPTSLSSEYDLTPVPNQTNLGAFTRTVGAVALLYPASNGGVYTTTTGNTNGIIGGWATYNAQDWAVANGSGDISAPASYTNDTWSAGANVTVTTNSTQTNATANSLRFGLAQTNTVTLSGTCTLSSGGILVDFYNGANVERIQGGILKGAAGADLVVNNFDTTVNSGLEIDSTIADNTSATALTLTGGGVLTLTAANTYTGGTYIDYGTLNITSNANLGSPAVAGPLYLEFGKQSLLNVTGSFALDNAGSNPRPIVVGGFGGEINDTSVSNTLTIDGTISGSSVGILTLNGSATFNISNPANTFGGFLNGGNVLISSDTAAQDMTVENQNTLSFASGVDQVDFGGLAGGGNIQLEDRSGNPVFLYIGGNNKSTNYYGQLNMYGFLYKNGTGTTTLSGTVNYSAVFLVNSGALAFSGTATLPAGSSVSNNATLILDTNVTTSDEVYGNGTTTIGSGDSVLLTEFSQYSLVNNGTLTITSNGTIGRPSVSVTPIMGGGTLNIGTSTSTATVSLVGSSQPSSIGALSISSGSKLNIANDRLFIVYGSNADPIASIAALLKSGYAGGAWNGPGIDSTVIPTTPGYGIGYADSADAGNPAGLPSGTIEVMYTLLGDANLSGVVDGIDFGIVAANFNKGVTGWDQGDFNYDNVVDGTDFGDLAANFNKGASGAAAEWAQIEAFAAANGLMADIPEPVSLGVLTLGTAGILSQRRRTKLAKVRLSH